MERHLYIYIIYIYILYIYIIYIEILRYIYIYKGASIVMEMRVYAM
jgi:hypothetical protein